MDDNDYDEGSRHLAKRSGAAMMHWLLELDATHLYFDEWIDPVLVWPGMKERVCDALARMADLDKGGIPCAGIVEFQTVPEITRSSCCSRELWVAKNCGAKHWRVSR